MEIIYGKLAVILIFLLIFPMTSYFYYYYYYIIRLENCGISNSRMKELEEIRQSLNRTTDDELKLLYKNKAHIDHEQRLAEQFK